MTAFKPPIPSEPPPPLRVVNQLIKCNANSACRPSNDAIVLTAVLNIDDKIGALGGGPYHVLTGVREVRRHPAPVRPEAS